MKKKYCLLILLILFIIIMTLSLFQIITWQKDNSSTKKLIEEVQHNMDVKIVMDDMTIDVDYSKTQKINDEIVGWIVVNGTNINYPFVQHTDNSFYLNHSLDKSYNGAGWVFLDYRNSIEVVNKNMILYAHERQDGTMFGSLKNVLTNEWKNNEENSVISLSTKNGSYLYKIFSVYHIPNNDDYIQTDFSSDNEYLEFLNKLKERSIYDFDESLILEDHILTLSTCYYTNQEKLVVHAKLISDF